MTPITESTIRADLRSRVDAYGGGREAVIRLAREIGVSQFALIKVIKTNLFVSDIPDEILAAIGIKRTVVYERIEE